MRPVYRLATCLMLTIFALSFSVNAQPGMEFSSDNKKAIKAYEQALDNYNSQNLEACLEGLQDAVNKDPKFIEPHILLAQVYAEMRRIPDAIASLTTAIELNPNFFPNNHFFLGELLFYEGEYEKALVSFKKFREYDTGSQEIKDRADLNMRSCEFAIEALANPVDFDPKNLGEGVNSPAAEYYPCITADSQTLLFTRLVKDSRAFDGQQEDFYTSKYSDGKWQLSRPIPEINTAQNEGAPALSPDGLVLIFTACELNGDWGANRIGLGSCDLFFSQRMGKEWTAPVNLGEKVNSYYWDSQPSFAADGRTLYFVRGRRGRSGYEDQDIWVSKLDDTGYWSKPSKLQGFVNTPYNEESVMIHPDGRTLYFSSNGHPGMGGLDIFVSRLMPDGRWGKPENLCYPINTKNDENSLLVAADGKLAFFASDREGGYGDLDLYSFELPESARPIPVTYAQGEVFDSKSNNPLEARFELIDLESGEVVIESYSDPVNGEFLVPLPVDRDYALNVSRQGYLFYSENFSLKGVEEGKPYSIPVPLKKIEAGNAVVLNNVFFDTDKYELKPQSKVELSKLAELLRDNPGMKIELGGHTDNVGSDADNQLLSERRAQAVVDFLIKQGIAEERLIAKGYGESQALADNATTDGRAKNRRTEFKVLAQ